MPIETVGDVEIYYEVHGPSDAPPLLWIAGWGNSHWLWFRQIPAFQERYRCIVFDNRGVGKSSKPDYPYTIGMFADDTVGLMEALNIDQAHVIGVSMGGFIAQQVAVSYPGKARSLVLISTHFGGPNAIPQDNRTLAMMFASPTETISQEQALEMRYSVAYSSQFLQENKLLLKQVREWTERDPQPLYARMHQASATTPSEFDVETEVKQISAPTLIIQGTSDLMIPPRNAEILADSISTSKLALIEGGPHMIIFEHHDRVNKAILDFINEVENESFSTEPKRMMI
ncbi:MAG: alpha/beta fold hydrolase [Candidatus Thorarchaeota archaeon]